MNIFRYLFGRNNSETSHPPWLFANVYYKSSGSIIVASVGHCVISVTQCVGARWTSIDRSASVDEYANAINDCIMNSEDEIPEIECSQMNKLFYRSIGSSEPDLRKNWDHIQIQWILKTNSVDVFRMHRFASGNGAACSDDDKPFQVQYSRDWIPVAEEVRRLISIGPPELLHY